MLGQPETCQSCGYLWGFDPQFSRQTHFNVNASVRANGYLHPIAYLKCWRELSPLKQEVDTLTTEIEVADSFVPTIESDTPRYTAIRRTLEKHRDCGGWYEWKPNLTPKDHYDEQQMRELEELRRANDLK